MWLILFFIMNNLNKWLVCIFLNQHIALISQYTEFSQVLLNLCGNGRMFSEISFSLSFLMGTLKWLPSKCFHYLYWIEKEINLNNRKIFSSSNFFHQSIWISWKICINCFILRTYIFLPFFFSFFLLGLNSNTYKTVWVKQ